MLYLGVEFMLCVEVNESKKVWMPQVSVEFFCLGDILIYGLEKVK